jgi:hypothetical protein
MAKGFGKKQKNKKHKNYYIFIEREYMVIQ